MMFYFLSFPTIKLSHPEAERKFQKSFLRFSFCIYTGWAQGRRNRSKIIKFNPLNPSIMAFRASLELNNKEFDVLYSNYEFSVTRT